jgi:hypothetical protein
VLDNLIGVLVGLLRQNVDLVLLDSILLALVLYVESNLVVLAGGLLLNTNNGQFVLKLHQFQYNAQGFFGFG